MRNLTRVVTAACLVGLAAVSGAVSSVGATSPSPIGPAPFAIEPMVALTGHAGNGIGVYLSGPYGPDRTWIFSDIPSNAVDMPDWSARPNRTEGSYCSAGQRPFPFLGEGLFRARTP